MAALFRDIEVVFADRVSVSLHPIPSVSMIRINSGQYQVRP